MAHINLALLISFAVLGGNMLVTEGKPFNFGNFFPDLAEICGDNGESISEVSSTSTAISTTSTTEIPTSTKTPTQSSSESTTQTPSESTTQTPSESTTQTPSESTTQTPSESTTQTPSESTTQTSPVSITQISSESITQTPTETTSQSITTTAESCLLYQNSIFAFTLALPYDEAAACCEENGLSPITPHNEPSFFNAYSESGISGEIYCKANRRRSSSGKSRFFFRPSCRVFRPPFFGFGPFMLVEAECSPPRPLICA